MESSIDILKQSENKSLKTENKVKTNNQIFGDIRKQMQETAAEIDQFRKKSKKEQLRILSRDNQALLVESLPTKLKRVNARPVQTVKIVKEKELDEMKKKYKEFGNMRVRLISRQTKRTFTTQSENNAEMVRLYSVYREDFKELANLQDRSDAKTIAEINELERMYQESLRADQHQRQKTAFDKAVEDARFMDEKDDEEVNRSVVDYSGADGFTSEVVNTVRKADQWILSKAKEHRVEFVQNFLGRSLKERIYIYHLLENGRRKDPDDTDLMYSMTLYKPNLSKIQRALAGHWMKIWRKLPGFSNMYWNKISDGLQDLEKMSGDQTVSQKLNNMHLSKEKAAFKKTLAGDERFGNISYTDFTKENQYNLRRKRLEEDYQSKNFVRFALRYKQNQLIDEMRQSNFDQRKKAEYDQKLNEIVAKIKKCNKAIDKNLDAMADLNKEYNDIVTPAMKKVNKFFSTIKDVTDPVQLYAGKHIINFDIAWGGALNLTQDNAFKVNQITGKSGDEEFTAPTANDWINDSLKYAALFANGKGMIDTIAYFVNIAENLKYDEDSGIWDNIDKKLNVFRQIKKGVQTSSQFLKLLKVSDNAVKFANASLVYLTGFDMVAAGYDGVKTFIRSYRNSKASDKVQASERDKKFKDEDQQRMDYLIRKLKNPMNVPNDEDGPLKDLAFRLAQEEREQYKAELKVLKDRKRRVLYKQKMLEHNERHRHTKNAEAVGNIITGISGFAFNFLTAGAGGIAKIANMPIDLIVNGLMAYRKNRDKLVAIDNFLNIKDNADHLGLRTNDEKKALRKSLMARLGFAKTDSFFAHVITKYAAYIRKTAADGDEPMQEFIKSFGLKINFDKDGNMTTPKVSSIAAKLLK